MSAERSTLKLSEVARHIVAPAGIERSLWLGWDGQPGVEERVREFGYEFDTWQDGLAQLQLGVTAEGRFAATVGGIVLSIPRQVAKTFMTMVIVLALCSMFGNLTVLWTAHRGRLSTQTFGKMKALAKKPALRRHLMAGTEGVRSTNGEQEIRFRNGSRILFGAREHGFGLGFDEVDIEVFDEAQRLTSNALDDMIAATNQSRWSFGALLFFMGTPPRPTDEGEEFANRRAKALAIKADLGAGDFAGVVEGGEALYVECSADPDVGTPGGPKLDDRDQVSIANPSYPHRTPEVSIRRLRENLTNDDSWRREGLGVWDDLAGKEPPVISADEWEKVRVDKAPDDGLPCYGVRYSPDGAVFAVAVALKRDNAPTFVEVIDRESTSVGVGGLADWLADRWGQSGIITIDGPSHASALIEALLERGVPHKWIRRLTTPEASAAYPVFLEWVRKGRIQHAGAQGLTDSIAVSARRKIGNLGGWGFQPNILDGDVVPAESAVIAVAGTTLTKRRPGMPAATSGRAGGARQSSKGRRAEVR